MSEANPVDRKQFPLGTALVVIGLLALAAIAGHTALVIHSGTKEVLATIENATPTTHTLPPSTYILTRPNAVSTTRYATVTASAAIFSPDTTGGWIEFEGQRNLYLGTLVVQANEAVSLQIETDAYPVHIRRDPMTHVERVLIRAGILGSAAAVLIATGVFIAINRFNARQRLAREAFQALVE